MVFYPCIKCHKHIRPRQHAISCDSCGRWQHRTCQKLFLYTGWHNRLNTRAGQSALSFYRLVPVLPNEAERVEHDMRLVRDNAGTRRWRPLYRRIEEKICEIWDSYTWGSITTTQLLKKCGAVYAPNLGWCFTHH